MLMFFIIVLIIRLFLAKAGTEKLPLSAGLVAIHYYLQWSVYHCHTMELWFGCLKLAKQTTWINKNILMPNFNHLLIQTTNHTKSSQPRMFILVTKGTRVEKLNETWWINKNRHLFSTQVRNVTLKPVLTLFYHFCTYMWCKLY